MLLCPTFYVSSTQVEVQPEESAAAVLNATAPMVSE